MALDPAHGASSAPLETSTTLDGPHVAHHRRSSTACTFRISVMQYTELVMPRIPICNAEMHVILSQSIAKRSRTLMQQIKVPSCWLPDDTLPRRAVDIGLLL
jgi:hypothetical protein